MTNPPWVIDVQGLTKRFGPKTVVDQLNLQVRSGEIFGFLGPNGSGKTTSIRMLCGLLTPDAGQGQCLGLNVMRQSAAIRREVGYMTQRFSLWEDLSIEQNLDFVARMFEVRHRRERVRAQLDQLGLSHRRHQLAGNLSGGWKQRLALAACLLHQPRLLLLDEPTAGVDPQARRDFWEEIHALSAQGITVLVSTHYMDEAERCHRLAYMNNGRLLTQGTVSEVIVQQGLSTWRVPALHNPQLSEALRQLPGVTQVASFGNAWHVSGHERERLALSLANFAQAHQIEVSPMETSLEDVFMHLMSEPMQTKVSP